MTGQIGLPDCATADGIIALFRDGSVTAIWRFYREQLHRLPVRHEAWTY